MPLDRKKLDDCATKLDALCHRMDAYDAARADGPFQNMENKLAHEKHPPRDVAAVAAIAGRKALGEKEMERRSVAGKKAAAS